MAITEEIDLTLEADFAGEYFPHLLPVRVRQQEGGLFAARPDFDVEFTIRVVNAHFHNHNEERQLSADIVRFYAECFGDVEAGKMHDPYYLYWSGVMCDRCGVEMNLITKGAYGLCTNCEDILGNDQDDMEVN